MTTFPFLPKFAFLGLNNYLTFCICLFFCVYITNSRPNSSSCLNLFLLYSAVLCLLTIYLLDKTSPRALWPSSMWTSCPSLSGDHCHQGSLFIVILRILMPFLLCCIPISSISCLSLSFFSLFSGTVSFWDFWQF